MFHLKFDSANKLEIAVVNFNEFSWFSRIYFLVYIKIFNEIGKNEDTKFVCCEQKDTYFKTDIKNFVWQVNTSWLYFVIWKNKIHTSSVIIQAKSKKN